MWVGDAVRLHAYWKDQPPVHVMVGSYLGYRKKKLSDDELGALLGAGVTATEPVGSVVGVQPPGAPRRQPDPIVGQPLPQVISER